MIPFNVPYVSELSKRYVLEALNSCHQQGDGPFTFQSSKIISEIVGGGHVLLTPSCTDALEMASMLANLGPGDEVILPSYTFTSAAIAITKFGAAPVFVDIDLKTKCIDIGKIRESLTSRTKAISWVNYAGMTPDIEGLQLLAKEFNLLLIEDNAHGLGGSYKSKPLGSFGDFSTQSFHATKNIQCGEGGALVINNPKYVERAEIIREKGTNRAKFNLGQVEKYEWVDQGSSYLMAETSAAILLGSLQEFSIIQKKRQIIFEAYKSNFSMWADSQKLELITFNDNEVNPAHMFYLMTISKDERAKLSKHLRDFGIQSAFHYQSLVESPYGKKFKIENKILVNSLLSSNQILRLPLYPDLSSEQLKKVIKTVLEYKVE